MMRACALILIALIAASPAAAQIVTSTDVSNVSVTIYRDPNRQEGAMNANWPGGYALISETRTLRVPKGDSVIRFEGVAEGMLPETAIVTGLPKGVREKNRDARLISPAGLVDAYLKRSVTLKRTNRQTGKVSEQSAIIQAGPNGGVIISSAGGVEALGCSGLPERMLYDGVPADLSAKPTLSVLTTSEADTEVTVQLSYLAQGFDWSANYVATMADKRDTTSLFAWLTIANGGAQSFVDAQLSVIAGQPNKERNAEPLAKPEPALRLECWPLDITSTHPRYVWSRFPQQIRQKGMRSRSELESSEEIIVTAQMRTFDVMASPAPVSEISAVQEDLGDLKLYRVPIRVTVAAQAQKQVAMITQPEARFDRIYSANVDNGDRAPRAVPFLLRTKNTKARGLGLPLPAGGIALFETALGRPMLVGEAPLADRAIGEDVEIEVGASPDVQWTLTRVSETDRRQGWKVSITNARDVPIKAEIIVPHELSKKPAGVERRRGGWALPAAVPANGSAEVRYGLKLETVR